jgi:tellurite resistance protein
MRFYFHLMNREEWIADDVGIKVANLETARFEALRVIKEVRQEDDISDADWNGWSLLIADADGNALLCLPLDGQANPSLAA